MGREEVALIAMTMKNQAEENDWTRDRVQHVLDYHNKKYGTHIIVKGKTQNVYPHLKGKSDWDWVCSDTETYEEVAVEVKKQTEESLEKKDNITYQFFKEITNSLTDRLPGSFTLGYNITGDYVLPINQKNRQQLLELLRTIIIRIAPKLKVGQEVDMLRVIQLLLRVTNNVEEHFYIPRTLSCELSKVNDDNSTCLVSGYGLIWWQSAEFDEAELKKFDEMVSHANRQLGISNAKKTFLVLIESHSGREPQDLAKAFQSIKETSYSRINYIYFILGEKVTEIPLPTP